MAPRNPNPSPRATQSFQAPTAHRFDPLDYEAFRHEPLRSQAEALTTAIAYPTSWNAGAFSDQSLPVYPGWLALCVLSLLVGIVTDVTGSLAAIPIPTPWIAIVAVTLGALGVVWLSRIVNPSGSPLHIEALLAALAGLVLAAAFSPSGSPALRLFVVIASLAATAMFAHAVTEHLRAHLWAFQRTSQAASTDLIATPKPYLVLFVPLVFATFSGAAAPRDVLPLLVLPWLPALYLAYRALEANPRFASPLELLNVATESWVRCGTRGESAPGVFRSPAGPRLVRLFATLMLLLLLGAVFSPFPSFTASIIAGVSSPAAFAFSLIVWLGAALVPLSITGATTLALLSTALPDFQTTRFKDAEPQLPEAERWSLVTERLSAAQPESLRDQLFLGFHATEHYPVFLPKETLREHASIIGATSAGKTSRVLLPLLSQLFRANEQTGARGPVVIIDLKGERYFFNAIREEAERAQRPFWYFSNHSHRGTYAFNPVLDLRELGIPLAQVGSTLHAGLNLEHGTGYGASYFSAVTRNYLAALLELAPGAESIDELYAAREQLRKLYPRERERRELEREAAELISHLHALASRPELNVTSRHPDRACFESRISMKRALEQGAVVYFNLFSKGEEAIARFIGSLALECLYAGTYRFNEDPPADAKPLHRRQVYAVVDEFQRIAGRNFGVFLEQARSAGLSLILAKQSETVIDAELQDAVQTNTTYRHYFTFRSAEAIAAAGKVFGETAYHSISDVDPTNLSHFLGPRFTPNDLRALSALPGYAASVQETSREFSQFHGQAVAIFSPFHITREERDRVAAKPLPVGEPGTLIVGAPAQTDAVGQGSTAEETGPASPVEATELAASFGRIQATHEGYTIQEGG